MCTVAELALLLVFLSACGTRSIFAVYLQTADTAAGGTAAAEQHRVSDTILLLQGWALQ